MAEQPIFIDGVTSFDLGINSGIAPLLLPPNQLSFSINGSVRGAFITHRPCWRKMNMNFGGDIEFQEAVTKSLFQGAGYYRPDYGSEMLIAHLAGRQFTFTPDSGTNATVAEITIPGDPSSTTALQAWWMQAEQFFIFNDGVGLPFIYDGATSRRSYGPSSLLATTANIFVIPAQGENVQVQLTQNYTGTYSRPVLVDGKYYTLLPSGSGNPNAKLTRLTAPVFVPAGSPVAAGLQVLVIPSRVGALTGGIGPSIGAQCSGIGSSGLNTVQTVGISYPANNTGVGIINQDRGVFLNFVPGDRVFVANGAYQVQSIMPNQPATVVNGVLIGVSGYSVTLRYNGGCASQSAASAGAIVTIQNTNPNVIVGTIAAQFLNPAQLASVQVELSTAYVGSPQVVWIGEDQYIIESLSVSPTPSVTLQNINATAGGTVTAGTGIFSVPELPAGRMGAYGRGRVWESLIDGRSFIAGDLVGSSSGTAAYGFRDAVLRITENNFLAGGGVFAIPGSAGDIRSMTFTATLDASLGQGPLQVGTPFIVFSCNAPVDRTTWQNLENPILTESLIGYGPLNQEATRLSNSDTIFRSSIGLGSLILARREFTTWGNTPISREVQRIINQDTNRDLLIYGSGVDFNNRRLTTSKPAQSGAGVSHRGLISLNFEPISSLGGKSQSVYDGLWTGVNVLRIVSGFFGGVERCFAFSYNSVIDELELYELLLDDAARFDNNGDDIPITWTFETASLFKNVKGKGQFDSVRLEDGEFYLADIVGTVEFQVWYKPSFHPCWILWHSGQVCARQRNPDVAADALIKPASRVAIGIGKPSINDCDPINKRPYAIGETFQFKFTFTGSCKFYGALFKASLSPKPYFEKVVCDLECATLECVGDDDYGAYELQDRPQPEPQTLFNQRVFYSPGCGEDEALEFSGTLPGWITIDTENNRLVGASGTFSASSQAEANVLAQNALNAFAEAQLADDSLACNPTVADIVFVPDEVVSGFSDFGPLLLEPTGGTLWAYVESDVWSNTDGGLNWTALSSDLSGVLIGFPRRFAFGASVHVCVQSGGGIATSPDAVTWTDRTSDTAEDLSWVVFGNSLFVAVGANGEATSSADGITWSSNPAATSETFFGVAYGEGLFVAVGSNGVIFTSANGTAWTSRTSGTTEDLASVAYGDGMFVAVGENGEIVTSPDGVTWTVQTSGATQFFEDVAFIGDSWYAVGGELAGGFIYTSTDGVTWTQDAESVAANFGLTELRFLTNIVIAVQSNV